MLSENSRYVVLGAAGFIGFHIANYIRANTNSEIILVDNFIRGERDLAFSELASKKKVSLVERDLTLIESYEDLFRTGDVIFNLVALNGTQNFYANPNEVLYNSAMPSILAPRIASASNVAKYVYFGSSESYAGGLPLGLIEIPTPEDVPFVIPNPNNPRWSYAISKQVGEVACHAVSSQLDFTILRIHNVYGPRMGFQHVIPDLIQNFISGDGRVMGMEQTRSFLFIDDAVQAVLSIIRSSMSRCETFNVGSKREISISKLAELILEYLGIELPLVPVPAPWGSVERRTPRIDKMESLIDFSETPIEVGLRITIDWYRNFLSL